MPLMRREVIQLGLLLLCVPVQFYISSHWSFDNKQRDHSLKSLINTVQEYKESFLEWESWKRWSSQLLQKFHKSWNSRNLNEATVNLPAESPAIEVLTYRNKYGFFGASAEIRHYRSEGVKFRIGQVVTHKIWGYSGVIIGWDEYAKAPESWLEVMHPADKKHWKDMPNYAVLVDVRDRSSPQVTYVPQENLAVVNRNIKHPQLDNYFSEFDGVQYLPRPWLRTLYPSD